MYGLIYSNYVDFIPGMKDSFKYIKMSKYIDVLVKQGSQWEKRELQIQNRGSKEPCGIRFKL